MFEYKKYKNIETELKQLCSWVDFKEYIRFYSGINWNGKTVLDIGADIGSSAVYFLMNGAKRVICIESDHDSIETAKKLGKDGRFKKFYDKMLWIKAEDYEESTEKYIKGLDVLKMDCEGCEMYHPMEKYMMIFDEWVIGLHKEMGTYKFEKFQTLLLQNGGKFIGNPTPPTSSQGEYVYLKRK